ncbi:MAG TPA: hypothetical protein VJ276_15040, partial [Thermoanaerobaculia bacterium]|nr:hypothetical protein [Thermoanaerobaculia bacterium]
MKPSVRAAALCAILVFPLLAAAAPFTNGSVVVVRVGDGVTALSGNSAPAFLDEYSPAGTLIQSIPLPTAVA